MLKQSSDMGSFPSRLKNLLGSSAFRDESVDIHLLENPKPIVIKLNKLKSKVPSGELFVRDVIYEVCSFLHVQPRSVSMFGLVCFSGNNPWKWIPHMSLASSLIADKKHKFYLRIQFKYLELSGLKEDIEAYGYYVKQCRDDFHKGLYGNKLEGKGKEAVLLRMVILELMMIARDNGVDAKDVLKKKKLLRIDDLLKRYNKESGKEIAKCKRKIENSLIKFKDVQDVEKDFVTEVKLLQDYKEDVFHLLKVQQTDGKITNKTEVELWISSSGVSKKVVQSNIRRCLWSSQLCDFHLVERKESAVPGFPYEIKFLREGGPPEIFYCSSEQQAVSVCCFIDGYYRLLVNQYRSLLADVPENLDSPSVHGPIERRVAEKVLTYGGLQHGNYLFRESRMNYNEFVLSTFTDDERFVHLEIAFEENKCYFKDRPDETFRSLDELEAHYRTCSAKKGITTSLKRNISPREAKLKNYAVPLFMDPALFRPPLSSRAKSFAPSIIAGAGPVVINPNEIKMEAMLAQGSFGDVFKCRTVEGQLLVVKKFSNFNKEAFESLIEVLMKAEHENILRLVGISFLGERLLAFEYAAEGPLDRFLESHRNDVTLGDLLRCLQQLTSAVVFLHDKNLVHGDLRLGNVLLHDLRTIKLKDCCLNWKLRSEFSVDMYKKRYSHFAPEIILGHNADFTIATDVWAFGVTVWHMFTLKVPFAGLTIESQKLLFDDAFTKHELSEKLLLGDPFSKCKMADKEHRELGRATKGCPPLLSMSDLPYCHELLYDVITKSLSLKAKDRPAMTQLWDYVQSLAEVIPTIDRKKEYFAYVCNEEHKGDTVGHRPSFVVVGNTSPPSLSLDKTGTYTTLPSMPGPSDKRLGRDRWSENFAVSRELLSTMSSTGPSSFEVNEFAKFMSNAAADHDVSMESVANLAEKTGNTDKIAVPDRLLNDAPIYQTSFSAPSSPNRSKVHRSISMNEPCRQPEEMEVASILKSLQEASEHGRTLANRQLSLQIPKKLGAPSVESAVQGGIAGDNDVLKNIHRPLLQLDGQKLDSGPASSQDGRLLQRQASVTPCAKMASASLANSRSMEHLVEAARSTSPKLQSQSSSNYQVLPLAPDSPEMPRRDFFADNPQHDRVQNEATRKRVLERINSAREQWRISAKRSLALDFEDIIENANKAAKRAAHGPNPFNIGSPPPNFLQRSDLRSDKPRLPPDVTRFFRKIAPEAPISRPSSPSVAGTECAVTRSAPADAAQSSVEEVLRGIQDLSANSPKPAPAASISEVTHSSGLPRHDSIVSSSGLSNGYMSVSSAFPGAHSTVLQPLTHLIPTTSLAKSVISNPTLRPKGRKPNEPQKSQAGAPVFSSSSIPAQVPLPSVHPTLSVPVIFSSAVPIPRAGETGSLFHIPPEYLQQIMNRFPAVQNMNLRGPPPLVRGVGQQSGILLPKVPVLAAASVATPTSLSGEVPVWGGCRPSTVTVPPSVVFANSHSRTQASPIRPAGSDVAENVTKLVSPEVKLEPVEHVTGAYLEKVPPVAKRPSSTKLEINPALFIPAAELDYSEKSVIGGGHFGVVYKAKWKKTGTQIIEVAVKMLKKQDEAALEEFRGEAAQLAKLISDRKAKNHVITLYGVCEDAARGRFLIVTEYLQDGSLRNYISKHKATLQHGRMVDYGMQIAEGMVFLQSKGIVHRDLATRNILVSARDGTQVKISDFGLSRCLIEKEYSRAQPFVEKEYYKMDLLKSLPLRWFAIECLAYGRFTKQSDVWSFGVLVWEMFSLWEPAVAEKDLMPYKELNEPNEILTFLDSGKRLSKPARCSDDMWRIVLPCWDKDEKTRPTFESLVNLIKEVLKNDVTYAR